MARLPTDTGHRSRTGATAFHVYRLRVRRGGGPMVTEARRPRKGKIGPGEQPRQKTLDGRRRKVTRRPPWISPYTAGKGAWTDRRTVLQSVHVARSTDCA